jgi:hypothetical protein
MPWAVRHVAPKTLLHLSDNEPTVLDAGSRLQTVGQVYGAFGVDMAVYFAS